MTVPFAPTLEGSTRQMIADLSRDPEAMMPCLSTVHTHVTSAACPEELSAGGRNAMPLASDEDRDSRVLSRYEAAQESMPVPSLATAGSAGRQEILAPKPNCIAHQRGWRGTCPSPGPRFSESCNVRARNVNQRAGSSGGLQI